jgi:hypothetical protein
MCVCEAIHTTYEMHGGMAHVRHPRPIGVIVRLLMTRTMAVLANALLLFFIIIIIFKVIS